MSGVDWSQVTQNLLNGIAWGIGFTLPFVIGLAILFLSILVHPTLTKIARAADKLSKGSGDVWTHLVDGGIKWLTGGDNKKE